MQGSVQGSGGTRLPSIGAVGREVAERVARRDGEGGGEVGGGEREPAPGGQRGCIRRGVKSSILIFRALRTNVSKNTLNTYFEEHSQHIISETLTTLVYQNTQNTYFSKQRRCALRW